MSEPPPAKQTLCCTSCTFLITAPRGCSRCTSKVGRRVAHMSIVNTVFIAWYLCFPISVRARIYRISSRLSQNYVFFSFVYPGRRLKWCVPSLPLHSSRCSLAQSTRRRASYAYLEISCTSTAKGLYIKAFHTPARIFCQGHENNALTQNMS